MSSEKTCGKHVRRKSKVSWGRLIRPGLVDPKSRAKAVDNGQYVNIRILTVMRYQRHSGRSGLCDRTVGCVRLGINL